MLEGEIRTLMKHMGDHRGFTQPWSGESAARDYTDNQQQPVQTLGDKPMSRPVSRTPFFLSTCLVVAAVISGARAELPTEPMPHVESL